MESGKLKGYAGVVSAYFPWGVLPLYWNLLKDVPAFAVLFQRVFWSMLTLEILLLAQNRLSSVLAMLRDAATVKKPVVSAAFAGTNWLVYIWAMGRGEFVAASMGYFICPLLIVGCGAVLFKERLRFGEQLAMGCLGLGISVPIFTYGSVPWIAVLLASSWAGYTYLRKRMVVGALEGVFLETVLLVVPLGVISWFQLGGMPILPTGISSTETFLLVASGIATALPQILLINGSQQIPLKVVGILQYLAPTLMLAISVLCFAKHPEPSELLSLGFIWVGVILFFLGDRLAFDFPFAWMRKMRRQC